MTTTLPSAATRPDLDLLDPAFYLDDPHAAYRWMRANEPVYRSQKNELWAITRHADVHDVESRNDVFVSGQGYRSFGSPGETNMIAQDDPRHAEQRKLVSRRFTPKAVRGHEAWMTSTITELIDAFASGPSATARQVEVIGALAAPLPCRLTARLLGWPEDRWTDVKSWSERLMQYDRLPYDPDAGLGMLTAIVEFNTDLVAMIEERRRCPMDDLVSVWAGSEIDGQPLDHETIMHETGLFISGGAETTRTVIARALRVFCDHNDQWELLAAEPARVPTAVDEMIRWVTPLHNFFRTAVVATQIGEQAVAAGDRIMLLYPSANRDEAVFTDPDRFDVTRSPNPHLGFGFGTHFCLGASLARFELTTLFTQLTRRITNLRVVTETDDEPNVFAHAVRSFNLGFDIR